MRMFHVPSPFRTGLVAGVALVFALSFVVNRTTFADWVVAPLLVPDTPGPVDALVVLGASVIGDCVPSHHGVRRVLLAVRTWRTSPDAVMLFTGGTGGSCPVAVAMARFAQELGVPADKVRVETASLNTHENAVMSSALLRAWNLHRVALVTDRLHMTRAARAFAGLGVAAGRISVPIQEGHEDNMSMLGAGLREFAALAYYRLRGWLGPLDRPANVPTVNLPPGPRPAGRDAGPIVLLGASYAEGWPLSDVGGIPVINKGVAGEQSFEMLARFDRDVVAAAPRAVVVWGFINDITRSTGIEASLARIQDSYVQMIARARAHGIVPILATEVTARPPSHTLVDALAGVAGRVLGKEAYQDRINRHLFVMNQWVNDLAAREGLLVLQLQSVIAEPGGRRHRAFAQADGSHITPAGYDMLTTYARPILQEFLVARQ